MVGAEGTGLEASLDSYWHLAAKVANLHLFVSQLSSWCRTRGSESRSHTWPSGPLYGHSPTDLPLWVVISVIVKNNTHTCKINQESVKHSWCFLHFSFKWWLVFSKLIDHTFSLNGFISKILTLYHLQNVFLNVLKLYNNVAEIVNCDCKREEHYIYWSSNGLHKNPS